VVSQDLGKAGAEGGAGEDPVAAGLDGGGLELLLDVGDEAQGGDIGQAGLRRETPEGLQRPAALGVEVEDDEPGLLSFA
jgi:hypothetical protein